VLQPVVPDGWPTPATPPPASGHVLQRVVPDGQPQGWKSTTTIWRSWP